MKKQPAAMICFVDSFPQLIFFQKGVSESVATGRSFMANMFQPRRLQNVNWKKAKVLTRKWKRGASCRYNRTSFISSASFPTPPVGGWEDAKFLLVNPWRGFVQILEVDGGIQDVVRRSKTASILSSLQTKENKWKCGYNNLTKTFANETGLLGVENEFKKN